MQLSSFEESYFRDVYGGNYYRRNPPYKWRAFIKQILVYKQNGRLLDIGCALGLFIKQASLTFECTGCDVSTYALEQARKNVPDSISLFQCELGEISSQDLFDVVTCFDILEHIQDLDTAFNNLINLLLPGGILVMTVPVYDGPLGRLVDYLDHDLSHIHRREREFWRTKVTTYFRLQSYLGVWRYFFFDRFYLSFISSKTHRWSPAILLIAKKE